MANFFDCQILYSDKTISNENLCATKTPIAVIVTPPGFARFAFSLIRPELPTDIDQAEAYAVSYKTDGTNAGDWVLPTSPQVRTIAAQARTVQGVLIELAEAGFAKRIQWGVYYLCRRTLREQRYLCTTGIPCGQVHEIPQIAIDHVCLTMKNLEEWLKA